MITKDGRGILNDWDHAGDKNHLAPAVVSNIHPRYFWVMLIVGKQGDLAIHVVRAAAKSRQIA